MLSRLLKPLVSWSVTTLIVMTLAACGESPTAPAEVQQVRHETSCIDPDALCTDVSYGTSVSGASGLGGLVDPTDGSLGFYVQMFTIQYTNPYNGQNMVGTAVFETSHIATAEYQYIALSTTGPNRMDIGTVTITYGDNLRLMAGRRFPVPMDRVEIDATA
jgi:hypothetical protein